MFIINYYVVVVVVVVVLAFFFSGSLISVVSLISVQSLTGCDICGSESHLHIVVYELELCEGESGLCV